MRYTFEWDPIKARVNARKHRISFERAPEVFLDPMAISIYDQEHDDAEDRWVTIGEDLQGRLLVLIHTFVEVSPEEAKIRFISVRKATRKEAQEYREAEP